MPAWPDVACVQSHEAPWFFYVSAPWAVVVLVVFSSWLCSCAPWVFSSWLCFCAPCAFGFFIVSVWRVFGFFIVFALSFGASRRGFVFVFSSWLCFCASCAFFRGCLLFPPYEGVFGTFSEDWFRYASRSG